MKPKSAREDYWREYPHRDPEYVRWYPPRLNPITPEAIWRSPEGPDQVREIAYYVHVPFCYQPCKYCPFTKNVWTEIGAQKYVQALKQEITLAGRQSYLKNSTVVAGYLGGGTPTTLSLEQLAEVMAALGHSFPTRADAEVSIEANPDTVDSMKLAHLQKLGFNRISFGVQSFHPALLARLGRTHGAESARLAIQAALANGFGNVGLDLMYGLPGQDLELWEDDLKTAISLGVHQVTVFCLYLPPGTALFKETKAGSIGSYPQEEEKWLMYQAAADRLTKAGYQQYTAYDFALPGKDSRHHAINWRAPQGEYLGLGPGAFSHIHRHIFANISSMDEYATVLSQGRLPVAKGSYIDRQEEMARFMVLGLKYLTVKKSDFFNRFGVSLEEHFGPILAQLQEFGLILEDVEEVSVTQKGKTYLGNVCKAFYTPEQKFQPQPRV